VCQLGEAILTERVPQLESVSIRLIDARSPQTRTLEEEQGFLFAGGDSDDDDDAKDEEEKLQEKNSLLTHSGARVSKNDLTEVEEDDGYESLAGVLRPHGGSGRRGNEEGTLSSKAGIILVRFFFLSSGLWFGIQRLQGIQNIFIVIPQFLVTGFAAILFAIVDPAKPGHHASVLVPHPGPATNVTMGLSKNITDSIIEISRHVVRSVEDEDASHSNSIVYMFRYAYSVNFSIKLRFNVFFFSVVGALLHSSLSC